MNLILNTFKNLKILVKFTLAKTYNDSVFYFKGKIIIIKVNKLES